MEPVEAESVHPRRRAPALIGVDWGTSNLRAALIDSDGAVLAAREAPLGVRHAAPRGFAAVFEEFLGGWLADHPHCAVIMCGMVGSRQGWLEVPYVDCPCDEPALARALTPVPGDRHGRAFIVPGVRVRAGGRAPDVMRGEETQVFGALEPGQRDAVLCLPGTHSKWVVVRDRAIEWFTTHMTGEVFDLMTRHSILATLMQEDGDDAGAFRAGLARAGEPGGLLHHVFSVRAQSLLEMMPARALRSFLSGILVGHEVRAALALTARPRDVVLVGADALRAPYAAALGAHGVGVHLADAGACFAGLLRAGRAAGVVG